MKTMKMILLLLVLETLSASGAMAGGGTVCNCSGGTCISAGMTWPISACPECACGVNNGGTGIGPQPYSQPVDSTFLKNNLNYNWNDLRQFMNNLFSPFPPALMAMLLVENMQPSGQQGWNQKDYELFLQIMAEFEKQAVEEDLEKDRDRISWALAGITPEEGEIQNKIADRLYEKMQAISEMFPALDHVDPDTLEKLRADAEKEVRAKEEENKKNKP